MAKAPKVIKPVTKRVRATCKAANFEIDITAEFKAGGLASFESDEVKRRLRQGLADMIAKLPFAEVYPNEVRLR